MKKIFAALILVISCMSFVIAAPAAPANAVPGCSSQVQLKADNWSENVGYNGPNPARPWQSDFFVVRLTATLAYWHCPNGTEQTLVKIKWADFCWSHIDPNHGSLNFDGAKFNPYYYDSNESTNPPETIVSDDGSVQNCKTQDVSLEDERWFEMQNIPKWKVTSWVRLSYSPDQERVFKHDGNEYKLIRPHYDVAIGDWHW